MMVKCSWNSCAFIPKQATGSGKPKLFYLAGWQNAYCRRNEPRGFPARWHDSSGATAADSLCRAIDTNQLAVKLCLRLNGNLDSARLPGEIRVNRADDDS